MKRVVRRIDAGLRALMLVLVAGSCMDQEGLFGPEPEGRGPRVRLVGESYSLHAGDRVELQFESLGGGRGTAGLLAFDSRGEVVWRSTTVTVEDSVAEVPVTGLSEQVLGATGLRLTATAEVDGARIYASDDTAAALDQERAALRPVTFYAGEAVGQAGGVVQSLALDPATGTAWFSSGGRIARLDLATGRELASTSVPGAPVTLGYFHGRLAALLSGGTELAVFDAGSDLAQREQILLPTLRIEVQTAFEPAGGTGPVVADTVDGTVRPYAHGFRWGCGGPGCVAPVLFAASDVVGVDEVPDATVMRRVGLDGRGVEPLLVPKHQAGLLPEEGIPSRVRVFGASSGGADSVVLDREDRMRCPTLSQGAVFDVSRTGHAVLYVATSGEGCGDGTRMLRIDEPAGNAPRVSGLARRNLLGEDRLGPVAEVRVSPDGAFVLVRADGRVHLFDADLRLRSTIEVADPSSVAWVEGDSSSVYFAVGTPLGVALYDVVRGARVAMVPLGPCRENLLLAWRAGPELVVVVSPRDRDGLVTARVPLP